MSLTEEALSSWPAERLFDASWAATTVQRALRGLCEECESKGRRRVFEVLSPYLSAERDDLSYATLATKLRVPESFVKKLIYRMRQRYRMLLREEVRQTVADPAEVDERTTPPLRLARREFRLGSVRLLLLLTRQMKPSPTWSRPPGHASRRTPTLLTHKTSSRAPRDPKMVHGFRESA